MTNLEVLTEHAQLRAEIKLLSSQMAENMRLDLKPEDYPDTRSWMNAVKANSAKIEEQTKAIREKEMRLHELNQALVSLSLALLNLVELPHAEICQQLQCSAEIASVLQDFVALNFTGLPCVEMPRNKPTEPVPFPG